MKVIPAPGSKDMQDALNDKYVNKAADLLLEIYKTNREYFKRVAFFLKSNYQGTSSEFLEKLQALRENVRPRLDVSGHLSIPLYVDELIKTLGHIYERDEKTVGFQRGAIVELFAGKLVRPRCENGEYFSNHRFVESLYGYGYSSGQIDVVVFSEKRRQVEGYSCKVSAVRVNEGDWAASCRDLADVSSRARQERYDAHVGVVCFEDSRAIRQRLRMISQAESIHAYGVDNMHALQQSPFER